MSWNYDIEWQLVKLKHQEDLEQARIWRLQQSYAQSPAIMQSVRGWLGQRMITFGNQLADIQPVVQSKACTEC